MEIIEEEREELLKIRANMDPSTVAALDQKMKRKDTLESTQNSSRRPKSREFRVNSRRRRSSSGRKMENVVADLKETKNGGIKIIPHNNNQVALRGDLTNKINGRRGGKPGSKVVKTSNRKAEEPEFYNLLDELKILDDLG
jgi:hypothetical protein